MKKRSERKAGGGADRGAAALAYSVKEFCRRHSISAAMFYKLRREGRGPVIMKIGSKTLISIEAAEGWRRDREKEWAEST